MNFDLEGEMIGWAGDELAYEKRLYDKVIVMEMAISAGFFEAALIDEENRIDV